MSGWSSLQSTLVSIYCITYNHEKFIAEAIDGFLMQITTFPFEIIIGEDCSTDDTMRIIKNYEKEYPHLIKVLTSDTNIGMQKNFERTFKACKSPYIALCEGDDCWKKSNKLQKQITFLEANPNYSMSCHNSETYDDATNKTIQIFPDIKNEKDFSLDDLLNTNIVNTCTVVYRNLNINISEIFIKIPLGDWPLHMLHAEYGKIKFFPENMARYRVHPGGVWSSIDRLKQLDATILVLYCMNEYFEGKYLRQINTSITKYLWAKAFYYLDTNEPHEADICYRDAQKYGEIHVVDKVKYFLKKKLPSFYEYSSFIYQKMKVLLQKAKVA